MYKAKTTLTKGSVDAFIGSISDANQRNDCMQLKNLMAEVTGEQAHMWGPSIVGFGTYHYKYDSGHEGDMCILGFSPRKQSTTVYLAPGILDDAERVARVGKVKTGKGCLYIKAMDKINKEELVSLMRYSVDVIRRRYPDDV